MERPARRRQRVPAWRLLRPHGRAERGDVAPRALRRAGRGLRAADRLRGPRSRPGGRRGGVPAAVRRLRRLGLHVRRLQALHERRLPRRVPDRRPDPHGVRDRRAPARHLQRLRLLHPVVPVRRRRPRHDRRAGRQVHALLRPPRGRARARLREGVPDRLDPVRAVRGAGRGCGAAGGDPARARRRGCVPVRRARCRGGEAGRRPRRLLPAHRAARALRPAGVGRLADPGERPARDADRGGRRAARRRGRGGRLPRGAGAGERARHHPGRRRARRARVRDQVGREGRPPRRPLEGRPLVVPVRGGHGVRQRDARPRGDPRGRPPRPHRRAAGPDPGPDDEAAGVDVGGAALLLDGRDRVRLELRRARLRPRRRPRGRPARRGSSRWPPSPPVRCC